MKRFTLLTFVLLSVLFVAQANTDANPKRRTKSQTENQAVEKPQSEVKADSVKVDSIKVDSLVVVSEQIQPNAQAEPKAEEKPIEQPKEEIVEKKEVDSLKYTQHLPKANLSKEEKEGCIKPVKPFDSAQIIDTLATANKNLAVILLNDNSWRYVQTGCVEADQQKIYTENWDENYLFPYYNIPLASLPESTPIKLVDSLRAYHYPYKGYVTSRFGPRNGRRHNGMDISLKTGDTIRAVFNGKVRYSKFHENGYGELVVIRHDNGLETFSAHLSKRLVKAGERVVAGQVIGLGGSTGRSSGPHLHFEFRYKGQAFDPERIIDFKTGNLRRDFILLKRTYFDIYSKYEQDFNAEVTPAPKPATTTTTKTTTTKSSTAVKPTTPVKPKPAPQYYTVAPGDCLGKIAERFHTPIADLCRMNNMKLEDQDKIKIGQKLRVK